MSTDDRSELCERLARARIGVRHIVGTVAGKETYISEKRDEGEMGGGCMG